MTLSFWDHGFVAVLLLAIPVYGRFEYLRLVRRFAAGLETSKWEMYRSTILVQWALVATLLVLWSLRERAWSELGLTLRANGDAATGAAITAGGLAVLALQRHFVQRIGADGRARLRAQFERTWALLPVSDREHRWFRALAVTAGSCEELLYRGFLIPYCAAFVGESLGILLAAVVFGLGHFYQGARGVVKTFFVGVAAGLLYVKTESLLWPVILHVALDLQGGAIGRSVMAEQREADSN